MGCAPNMFFPFDVHTAARAQMSLNRMALVFVVLAAGACVDLSTAPRLGEMLVSVHITGADPDDNQLVIIIDSTLKRSLSTVYARLSIHDIASGPHIVELAQLAANCTVAGASMRLVTVERDDTTNVTFDVSCAPTGIAVTTRTTGVDTLRAYKVLIRDSIVARPAANDSVVVGHLKPGTFTVSLAVPIDNCAVASSNSVTTQAIAHRLVTLHFEVMCGPRVHVPKIAFVNDTTVDGRSGSWITQMNVDGTNVERLEPGQSPTWSPDGTQLAFSEAKCGYDFYGYYKVCSGGLAIVDVERWTVARPPIPYDVVLDPAWSPLDDRIAFVSCCDASVNHLYITRLNGSKAGDPVSSQLGYSHPSWSRDAERIAFSCLMLNHATTWDICIVPARGSQLTVLPRRPDDQASRALPAWSPDGTRIAFSRPGQLAIYTVATNEVTTLTEGTEPAWSPDGSMIVFTRQDGLFIINGDGSNLHRITRGRHSQAAWRP